MCDCQKHNYANAPCTCYCAHPSDSVFVTAKKHVQILYRMRRYEIGKRKEKAIMWIAWKCPRTLAYWITIRVGVENSPDYPAEQKIGDVLEKWRLKSGARHE